MATRHKAALKCEHEARNHNHSGSYRPGARWVSGMSFNPSCAPESACEQVASQADLPALRWLNTSGAA